MDPEAVRATLVIVILAIGSVTAALAYDAMVGPPKPEGGTVDDDTLLTLVDFQSVTLELNTEAVDFDGSGIVRFDTIDVPVANVTSLSATLMVTMQGPSVGDTFTVRITNPAGNEISGEVQRQANPNGYQISEPVVEGWTLAEAPESTHYETADEDEALRWAAENHTDSTMRGTWRSDVSLNPPVTPLRSGNVSLRLTFTYYVAHAFAPEVGADDDPATRGFFDARNATPSNQASPARAFTAFPEPS